MNIELEFLFYKMSCNINLIDIHEKIFERQKVVLVTRTKQLRALTTKVVHKI